MDKRLIVAAAISVAILVLWSWLFPPPPPPAGVPTPDPAALADAEAPDGGVDPGSGADLAPAEPTVSEPVAASSEETVEIDNGVFRVVLSNRGGGAVSWKLLEYTVAGGDPLELIPPFERGRPRMLQLSVGDDALDEAIASALYRVEREAVPGERGADRVTFHWSDGQGVEVEKSATFRENSYLVDVEARVRDRGRPRSATLVLGPGFAAQDTVDTGLGSYYYEAALWNLGGQVTHEKKGSLPAEPETVRGRVLWAGLEDQYFAAIAVPAEPQQTITTWSVERVPVLAEAGAEEVEPAPQPIVAVPLPAEGATLFVGPKKYGLLAALGHDLERAVWFSSIGFLSWISKQIFLALLWLHDHTVQNYGVAIILATFLLRLLLFPVNQYSMVSMKKAQLQMQRLQPRIKAIRAKYKKVKDSETRARMNQEMMDLYKREGVNPMGGLAGCLPLLAQFPILIGFYNMLTVAVELRGADFFGWINDLSKGDPWYVLPILMGGTMFLQQKLAMSKVKDPIQQQQQRFMMFMPVFFTYICLWMPSGMVLYWFVNNVLGIGQQWLVNRHTSRLEAAAQKA
jgi:YidC/Oxa1 family membrane protein insertase